ncbi:Hint domain-containing protein [Psychrobacter sp. AT9]|uniref:Hint domain-containing protein n=1 Tax=Psychrobacter TaxID=497 RepID=UPI0039A42571
MTNSGFVAGTRITTDKGIVPIEQIKVGDRVLSKPESGDGELVFKPVIRTMTHEDKELWQLTYVEIKCNTDLSRLTLSKLKQMARKDKFTTIKATPNHPFWVEGIGWTRLDHLEYGQIIHSKKNGSLCVIFEVSPVFSTSVDSVAAQSSIRNILDADKKGQGIDDVDYYNFPRYGDDGYVKEFLGGEDAPSPLIVEGCEPIEVLQEVYTTSVYNLEVEDFHTYYVWDLWVHNTNVVNQSYK